MGNYWLQQGRRYHFEYNTRGLLLQVSTRTREMTEAEIKGAYELETGKVIIARLSKDKDPNAIPGVLVFNTDHLHGVKRRNGSESTNITNIRIRSGNMAWHNLL